MEIREGLGSRVATLAKEYPETNRYLLMHQMYALQEQYRVKHGMYRDNDGLRKQEDFAYDVIKNNLEKGLYVGNAYTPPQEQ